VQAAEHRRIRERPAGTQALVQGPFEQRRLVEVGEHVQRGASRDGAADAERFDLAEDARAAPVLQSDLRSRAGQGGSIVVERPLAAKPLDRGRDVLVVELSPGESCADLRFGQLAPSQQSQSYEVGTIGAIGHAWELYAAGDLRPLAVEACDDGCQRGGGHLLA